MSKISLAVYHPTSRILAALMALRLLAAIRQGEINRTAKETA